MSINNISPNEWGPYAWRFMHYITMAYPDNPTNIDKQNMKMFFSSIGHILPCEKCRLHFIQHLAKTPLTDEILSTRINVINWFINIHNNVNKMLGKEIMTFNDVINKYEKNIKIGRAHV